jgi:flagellar motor switch/type III secretory pathway protein FliN
MKKYLVLSGLLLAVTQLTLNASEAMILGLFSEKEKKKPTIGIKGFHEHKGPTFSASSEEEALKNIEFLKKTLKKNAFSSYHEEDELSKNIKEQIEQIKQKVDKEIKGYLLDIKEFLQLKKEEVSEENNKKIEKLSGKIQDYNILFNDDIRKSKIIGDSIEKYRLDETNKYLYLLDTGEFPDMYEIYNYGFVPTKFTLEQIYALSEGNTLKLDHKILTIDKKNQEKLYKDHIPYKLQIITKNLAPLDARMSLVNVALKEGGTCFSPHKVVATYKIDRAYNSSQYVKGSDFIEITVEEDSEWFKNLPDFSMRKLLAAYTLFHPNFSYKQANIINLMKEVDLQTINKRADQVLNDEKYTQETEDEVENKNNKLILKTVKESMDLIKKYKESIE